MGIFTAAMALMGKSESQDTGRRPRTRRTDDEPESRSTLLVIDDDTDFLDTTRLLLESAGYEVLTSSTGPKGLDMARYAARDIGAVLLDFNMPRFNGAETLQFLRKLCPQAKILAVSGVSLKELPVEFREGVERFIPKPFTGDDLLKTIEQILQEKSGS